MNLHRLNVAGWSCQIVGTLFLLLDSVRVSIRLPREGATLGDPATIAKWYFHWASPTGFFFLLVGFALTGVVIWTGRRAHAGTPSDATADPSKNPRHQQALDEASTDRPRPALGGNASGRQRPVEHDPKHEYETVGENIRHSQNIYFAHLTVFVTVTAGLAAVALGILQITAKVGSFVRLFGLLFSAASWVNAEILLDRSQRLQERAVELEQLLGYSQYSAMPQHRIKLFRLRWLRPGTLLWHTLYAIVTFFWVALAFQWLK